MNQKLSEEEIVKAIKAQNKVEIKNIKCLKVHESKKKKIVFKNEIITHNAIIDIDGSAFKKFMEQGKINIEWDRCKVYELVSVHRCYKCLGYNHNATKCSIGSCCYKCGSKDHLAAECTKLQINV